MNAVVAEVERLSVPLRAVSYDPDDFVFQNLSGFRQRNLLPRHNLFFDPAKIDIRHAADLLFVNVCCF
jgi:hypothetical protein